MKPGNITEKKQASKMGQLSDELIEKIWFAFYEKQQSINRQMEEGERRYYQQIEESKRILEKSEKKFFNRLEERKRQLDETDNKFYQKMEAKRLLFENAGEKEEQQAAVRNLKKAKRLKKQMAGFNIEKAEHPVYSAILALFSERGYNFDEETLELYWKLIGAITRSAEHQRD